MLGLRAQGLTDPRARVLVGDADLDGGRGGFDRAEPPIRTG